MSPKVLDAEGRELKVGDRVCKGEREYTVVSVGAPYEGIVRVGYWHGSLNEYEPHFCIPGIVAEKSTDGTYRCPDLLLIDQPTKEGSRHG